MSVDCQLMVFPGKQKGTVQIMVNDRGWGLIYDNRLSWCTKSLRERDCSELKLQATEVEVSGVKNRPELPPITLIIIL